jgi:recombination DNA repair RAD52 pathway protein
MAKKIVPLKELTLSETVFSTSQLLTILQATPKEHIYKRPARGGGEWEYVTGVYVKKVLNFVFGWMWSFEIKSTEEKHGQVVVTGRLTIHQKDGSILLWKEDAGRADIKYRTETVKDPNNPKITIKRPTTIPLDYGNDLKAATTDCLKRCAAQFGVASDVYGKEEFKQIKVKIIEDLPEPNGEIEGGQEAEEVQAEEKTFAESDKSVIDGILAKRESLASQGGVQ